MYGYHNFSHFRVYLRIPNMIEITVDVFFAVTLLGIFTG